MKANILKEHGIETKNIENNIFALETCYNTNTKLTECNWINVTNFTLPELYIWLGY